MSTSIQISFTEALKWYAEMALQFSMSPIPDAERMAIVLERLSKVVAERKLAWQDALREQILIEDPEDPTQGSLPVLRARLTKLERKGAEWGAEYSNNLTIADRKTELMRLMQQANSNIETVNAEILTKERLLNTRVETTLIREREYKEALADYEKLSQLAPAIIEQTNALEEAEADRMKAIRESANGTSVDADAILQQLNETLQVAQANRVAADRIDAVTVSQQTVDQVIAAEERVARTSSRIAGWITQGN